MSARLQTLETPIVVTGQAARRTAAFAHIGNIAAALLPVPIGLLWLVVAAGLLVEHRRHPHPQARDYTRRSVIRLYTVVGTVLLAAVFLLESGPNRWLIAWGTFAVVMVPWSILSLYRIRIDRWDDAKYFATGD